MSFISKFKVVALQRQNVTFFGFRDPEDQEIRIVLPPSAEGIGLHSNYFRNLLNRPGMEDVKELVTYETFHPSQFDLTTQDESSNQPRKRGDRSQKYSCLPVTEVEVILSKINLNKIKDKTIRENLAVFHRGINSLIRKYYNEGGAVNGEATPEQKKTLREKLKETQEENAELREENSDLREENGDLSSKMDTLMSTLSIMATNQRNFQKKMESEVAGIRATLNKEVKNRTAAVARENKERKGRWKAENLVDHYEDLMDNRRVDYSSTKKKANREFEKNYSSK